MKKILILLSVMMILTMSMAMAVVDYPTDTINYWKFDGTLLDEVDSKAMSGGTFTTGILNQGVVTGALRYLYLNEPFVGSELKTIEFWADPADGSFGPDFSTPSDDYIIMQMTYVSPNNYNFRYVLGVSDSPVCNGGTIPITLNEGFNHFVAGTTPTGASVWLNNVEIMDISCGAVNLPDTNWQIYIGNDNTVYDNLVFSRAEYDSSDVAYSYNSGAGVEYILTSNTEPVINSISPSERVELRQGESQLYTADVTDNEADGVYSWRLDGVEVATTETYTANWDDIEAGIYTLTLNVSDASFSDVSDDLTLEIRARGGSGSGGAVTTNVDDTEDEVQTTISSKRTGIAGFFQSIIDWFRNLFGGN
jgi:hypothetical protein